MAKDKAYLMNLEAPGAKSGRPMVSVSKKGQIEVRKTKKGFRIELTND